MADQVAQATTVLTTASQMQDAPMMLMRPNANWEEYLTPAAFYIAIMGELVFISSFDDFSISGNPPADGYKYIKDPDSFRACLMQIYSSSMHAFSEAQKDMDQLRINTGKVPGNINTVLHTLFSGDAVIEILLPNQLDNIQAIADNYVTLTDGVKHKYIPVTNLMREVMEAYINTEMQNSKIKEVTIAMLGSLQEQWQKMMLFFEMVSNIVKISLSKTLHNFVMTTNDIKQLPYNDKLFAKDLLYKQAFQASNIAGLVHMISSTYTEVSNQYLMDRVSRLGKLMAMDQTKPEFIHEHLNLQQSCWGAQILKLVLKNKNDFERQTDARMAKIQGELNAVLPTALRETERIREIIEDGFDLDQFI